MKPVSFRYFAPRTVDDALDLLASHGEEGKTLAGGQSLVPAMNFRLARPTSLIDINRIDALDYVREEGGELRIGALARHFLWKHCSRRSGLRMVLGGRHTRCRVRHCQPPRAAQRPTEQIFCQRAHDDLGTGRAPDRDPPAPA